jgi:hypothetical protein
MGKNKGMRRSISILAAGSLLVGASIALAPSASACGAQMTRREVFRAMRSGDLARSGGAMETATLRTFHLEVKQDKKVYKIGDIAKIDVNVTRPANEDPLGEGTPMPWTDRPYVQAAEGAIVGVGLHIGRVFLPGAALTDANGDAKIRIKIENYAPANTVIDASVYAWRIVQETQCLTIQEDGYKILPAMGKTTRP